MKITSPHRMKRMLIKDEPAYVETIGKQDMENLGEIVARPDGHNTVVRQFFGATERMSVRALSYIASAACVAQLLPAQQLQIISVNNLGSEINGVSKDKATKQTEILSDTGMRFLQEFMPDVAAKTVFAEDSSNELIAQVRPLAQLALRQHPEIGGSLQRKGAKHGSDFVSYGAAHAVFQDTAQLEPIVIAGGDIVSAERIVAVGCQQERVFYGLRMALRELIEPELLIPSVQVFTKHVSPPYLQGHDREQSLVEALYYGTINFDQFSGAAHRDMEHFVDNFEVANNLTVPFASTFCAPI